MLTCFFRWLTIPLGEGINVIFDQLIPVIAPFFKSVSNGLGVIMDSFEQYLLQFHPLFLAILVALLVWFFVNKKLSIFTALTAVVLYGLGLWTATMGTLAKN